MPTGVPPPLAEVRGRARRVVAGDVLRQGSAVRACDVCFGFFYFFTLQLGLLVGASECCDFTDGGVVTVDRGQLDVAAHEKPTAPTPWYAAGPGCPTQPKVP